MTRRSPRYRITETSYGATVLTLRGDRYTFNGEPEQTIEYRVRGGSSSPLGGYVYAGDRQVCEGLRSLGSTLMATPDGLTHMIRRLARAHCDAADREWAAW